MGEKANLWDKIQKIIQFCFAKILKIHLTERQLESIMQFVKFGIVGLSNTIISYLIYVGSLWALQYYAILPKLDYLIAQFIGFILSVLWSFYWNNKYVFVNESGEKRNIFQALIKTYISYAFTGLFLNSVLSIIWVEVFHWSKMIAPIINLLVSVPLNFVMNKFWAFKNK